ncbi:MAG TPA: hypothetical protein VNU68_02035 [Verrucomicrobiae bacterium]|nr:hypothetical protein [Verrucomicrobiae bacterium]
MSSPSVSQIVRCLKTDMSGDLLAGAAYAERISRAASMNPWSPPGDSHAYAEAARVLRSEHEERERQRATDRMYNEGV